MNSGGRGLPASFTPENASRAVQGRSGCDAVGEHYAGGVVTDAVLTKSKAKRWR